MRTWVSSIVSSTGNLKKCRTNNPTAKMIVIGPGDLYTSSLANLIIRGMPAAIKKSTAKLVFIINLMTKFGQTYGFKASDFIREFFKYVGRKPDVILINKTLIPKTIKKHYWQVEKSEPLQDDLDGIKPIQAIRDDFLSTTIYQKIKADNLKRSLIRHDSNKLAKVLSSLLK